MISRNILNKIAKISHFIRKMKVRSFSNFNIESLKCIPKSEENYKERINKPAYQTELNQIFNPTKFQHWNFNYSTQINFKEIQSDLEVIVTFHSKYPEPQTIAGKIEEGII